MELWSPPHDAPHLLEWWRPLMLVSRRARLDRFPWPVHLDEFRLAGRVVRRGRPDVWIYEHHENGGAVCVDATGQTYRFTATPRSKGPGQFRECPVRPALWRARLPDVVEPVWYDEPDAGWADGEAGEGGIQDAVGVGTPGPVGSPTSSGASGSSTAVDPFASLDPASAAYAADEVASVPGDWRLPGVWADVDDDDETADDDWSDDAGAARHGTGESALDVHANGRVIRRGHLSLVAG